MCRWVVDELIGEIALHSTNQVVMFGVLALGDRPEGVEFKDRGP